MAVDPQSLVAYAYDLLQKNKAEKDNEVALRTGINRAYYGAFLTAKDHADIQNSGGSVHKEVIERYRRTKDLMGISNRLTSLKVLRQTADYKPDKTINVKEATNSCMQAKKILEGIDRLKLRKN